MATFDQVFIHSESLLKIFGCLQILFHSSFIWSLKLSLLSIITPDNFTFEPGIISISFISSFSWLQFYLVIMPEICQGSLPYCFLWTRLLQYLSHLRELAWQCVYKILKTRGCYHVHNLLGWLIYEVNIYHLWTQWKAQVPEWNPLIHWFCKLFEFWFLLISDINIVLFTIEWFSLLNALLLISFVSWWESDIY